MATPPVLPASCRSSPDSVSGFAGPLAGVLAGLDWAASLRPDCSHIASVATDAPFLPTDLVARLAEGLDAADADLARRL
jgi:molybdopterin-guanine dinucleotide biosynthesis protein A